MEDSFLQNSQLGGCFSLWVASSHRCRSRALADPSSLDCLRALGVVNARVQDGAAGALGRRRLPTDAADQEEHRSEHDTDGEQQDALLAPGCEDGFALRKHGETGPRVRRNIGNSASCPAPSSSIDSSAPRRARLAGETPDTDRAERTLFPHNPPPSRPKLSSLLSRCSSERVGPDRSSTGQLQLGQSSRRAKTRGRGATSSVVSRRITLGGRPRAI